MTSFHGSDPLIVPNGSLFHLTERQRYRLVAAAACGQTLGMALQFAPRSRLLMWVVKVVWMAAGVTGGQAVSECFTTSLARSIAGASWWVAIAAGFIALTVPSERSLTVLRLVAPALAPSIVAVLVVGDVSFVGVVALVLAMVVALAVTSGEMTEVMVQASAYGDEHRFPLRTPVGVLFAAVVVWLVWYCITLIAIVLLCHRSWVGGGVVGALSGALKVVSLSRLHRLSRRWLVLVPAGLVVHDPLVLGETLMVQRSNLAGIALALADTGAADLTGPASGVAVEVTVREMVTALFPASAAHPQGRAIHVQAYLVCPSRPGRTLRTLAAEGLPVG